MQGVPYLENSDFNGLNLLPNVNQGKSVVVMLQSAGCHHCENAKPAYQNISGHPSIMFATIQADEEQDIAGKLMQSKGIGGVPAYLGFNKNGELVSVHDGGRDEESLINFANSL